MNSVCPNCTSYTENTAVESTENYRSSTNNSTQSSEDDLVGLLANSSRTKVAIPALTAGNGDTYVEDNYLENYYYNYDDSVNYIPLGELIPNALGYGSMLVLGMIGNLLVITSVARYRRMHNVTNIFFLSLASADLLLISVCVPVKFARFFTFTWEYGEILCKAVHYFQNLTIICSVLNLTGLSLERYYAILHPMRAKYICTVTMARRSIILIWAMSVVMALPILVGQRHRLVGEVRKGFWCVEDWQSPVTAKVYNLYMFVVAFILPLGLMAFAYTSICKRLWNYVRPEQVSPYRRALTGSSVCGKRMCSQSDDYTRKQVVKMLIFVVALFAVCWGPVMLNNMLVAFNILSPLNHGFLKPMRQGFWLMAYINSCLNPIVYGFLSKTSHFTLSFRESFRNTMKMCVWRSSPRDITRHRTLWKCSFQAHNALQANTRSPRASDLSTTEHRQVHRENRPSMSSQGSTQVTQIKKTDGNLENFPIPD